MSRAARNSLIVVATLLGLLIAGFLFLSWYVRTDSFKSWLVTRASRGMGMELQVGGTLRIGVFPNLHLVVRDAHLFNRGTEVGETDEARVQVALLPLLQKRVDVTAVELDHPHFTIERAPDGELNVIRMTPPLHLRPHGPMEIIVKDATILYQFGSTAVMSEASGCDASLHDLRTDAPDGRRVTERVSFTGDMACREAHIYNFMATAVKVSMVAVDGGDIRLDPITMQAFGGKATGGVHARFSESGDRYEARYSLPQLEIAQLLGAVTKKNWLEGHADFSGDVTFTGHSIPDILHSISGPLALQGRGITFNGFDLDKELSRFEATQHFDLADLAAVLIAGPLGIVVTKGIDYARLKPKPGHGIIHELKAEVVLGHGIATAQDVAGTTDRHRVAMQGAVSLPDKSFDNTALAMVNAEGCATTAVTVTGPFKKPKLKKGVILKILAGPVTNLARKGESLVSKSGCRIFYTGTVKPY